ncbi:MAG: hypothetical protein IKR57_06535 [Bacilli bacterium]|nr:hypothetical protein [Bacilli bacterium]
MNNESNNLLLGKIGGNCKTYYESYFIVLEGRYSIKRISNYKIVYEKKGELTPYSYDTNGTELIVLNIIPFTEDGNIYFIVEVIDRNILLQHLEQEKMIAEKLLSNESTYKLGGL